MDWQPPCGWLAGVTRWRWSRSTGAPVVDKKPLGSGIDKVAFTAHDIGNRLVGIYLEADGTVGLESVYLLNE